jgi:phosphodiesterase/alkaline phosphatase D-like protein
MEFHENPFSRSEVVTCGHVDKQAYRKKLIGAFLQLLVVNARTYGNDVCTVNEAQPLQ